MIGKCKIRKDLKRSGHDKLETRSQNSRAKLRNPTKYLRQNFCGPTKIQTSTSPFPTKHKWGPLIKQTDSGQTADKFKTENGPLLSGIVN
jgi:hypothetical protein